VRGTKFLAADAGKRNQGSGETLTGSGADAATTSNTARKKQDASSTN